MEHDKLLDINKSLLSLQKQGEITFKQFYGKNFSMNLFLLNSVRYRESLCIKTIFDLGDF